MVEVRHVPRAVNEDSSERGGVSPLVLQKRAYAQESGGLRSMALTLGCS